MIRFFIKSSAVLLLILLFTFSAHASGKIEVSLNQKLTLKVEELIPNAAYKWILKKGKDIVSTLTNTLFNYEFTEPGEYEVNLITTLPDGTIRTTSLAVLVGQKFPRPGEKEEAAKDASLFNLETLPTLKDGRVHVVNQSSVMFNIKGGPDVLEYRVDQNIFEDSDANGTANDDVDNSADDSYLKGGHFEADYDPAKTKKVVAEVTTVARDGKKAKKQVEIIFDGIPEKSVSPVAILETLPAPSASSQVVSLFGEEAEVGFYMEKSQGNLVEYRIDKNIFADTSGDGDPANDIDNRNHPSFKTGDVWKTTYQKTDGQIIAQLIVVGADGKGSRVQRSLAFSDQSISDNADSQAGIRLTADKPFVLQGDPIRFSVEGLLLSLDSYTFQWDLDGDGFVDKEVQGASTLDHIFSAPGNFKVTVAIADKENHSGERSLEITVKETVKTAASFEFKVEGNTVHFTDQSTASLNLANKTLQYQWSFGDSDEANYEKQKNQTGEANPVYTYVKAGNYFVTLTVTDADQVVGTQTAEVAIAQDLESAPEEEKAEPAETESSPSSSTGLIFKILKIILYIVLAILAMIVFFLGGFMIFLKIQHPELTFDELLDEFKVKLLGKLGIDEDMIEHETHAEPMVIEPQVAPAPAPAPKAAPAPTPAPAPAPKAAEPEVLEGEVTEEKTIPPPHPPATGELAKPEGPVPDWLKGL